MKIRYRATSGEKVRRLITTIALLPRTLFRVRQILGAD